MLRREEPAVLPDQAASPVGNGESKSVGNCVSRGRGASRLPFQRQNKPKVFSVRYFISFHACAEPASHSLIPLSMVVVVESSLLFIFDHMRFEQVISEMR